MMFLNRHRAPLADEGLVAIEEVRASLDNRFEADWYEAMWCSEWPTVVVVWLLAFGGMATVLLGWTPFEALVPLCVWFLAARVIPTTILDRDPGRPVWARDVVPLCEQEVRALVALEKLPGGLPRLMCGVLPRNGKELWQLRERALLRQNLQEMMRREGFAP